MTRLTTVLLLALTLAAPVRAHASSARVLPFDDMVGLADEIVVGEVEKSEARWQGKLIFTTVTVRVDESLKGQPGARIEITQPGGTAVHPVLKAPVRMDVAGESTLQAGERVVLFVERRRPTLRLIVGGAQGRFTIREDAAAPGPAVPVGPKKLMLQREGAQATLASEAMTLDELRNRIRAVVEEQKR